MRQRWTGLAASVALVASLFALNGTVRAEADGPTWSGLDSVRAGDVAKCDGGADELNAAIIKRGVDADPDHTRVLLLGDGAYPDGSYQTYLDCYDKTAGSNDGWGQFKDKTFPVPGNHDYGQKVSVANAGYRRYWAPILDPLAAASGGNTSADDGGWYSTDIGNWHIIGLNWACGSTTNISCAADGPQGRWLQGDLAKANGANKHIVALWHGARFFSVNDNTTPTDPTDDPGPSTDAPKTNAYWRMLHSAGADIVLAGHHHNYEVFDHMSVEEPASAPAGDRQGQVDPSGPREFVVGTGGGQYSLFTTATAAVGSLERIDNTYGVLELTLHDNSYDWQFVSAETGQPIGQGGADVTHTTIPGTGGTGTSATTTTTISSLPPQVHPTNRNGYWMVGAGGKVYGFGTAAKLGDAGITPGRQAVDLEPTPSGTGYWVVDDAGGVARFGDALYHGAPEPSSLRAGETVTSLSSTLTGKGYWMFTNKGRVMAFGDATHFGDVSNTKLNAPVLDSIVTPSGKGYYMVASDGGIFTFGDATFMGSMGGQRLNAPVQSLVPTQDGHGYWLVASDGGIFAFGAAPFKGSLGGVKLARPVVGMVRYADGYLMVGADGGIFDFSSAAFLGSLGDHPPAVPIVSVAALG